MKNLQSQPIVGSYEHVAYRADIDGLRGLAILSVVLFHAFPALIPGGYIGVDIFFVISGFLISGIVFKNLEHGSFSLSTFYARRIKRIFPALVVVLLTCGIFGWFALLEDEFINLGKHLAGGAGFWSNFLLKSEAGYFDTSAETKILLHLWSLAIEEQFYIVFPTVIVLVYRKRPTWLSTAILLVLVYSFYKNIALVDKSIIKAFYLPKSRAWELLLGVALAYQMVFRNAQFQSLINRACLSFGRLGRIRGQDICAFTGSFLLIAGFTLINKNSLFPGWWATLPTLGAFLLIAAGPQALFNRVILMNPFLKWLGLISFSLYLWHWPLLSFSYLINGAESSLLARTSLVMLSVVLAALTTRYIEQPLRFGSNHPAKVWGLLITMTAVGLLGVTIKNSFLHPRIYSDELHKIIAAKGEWEYPPRNSLVIEFENQKLPLLSSNRPETTLFLGDSNIEQYAVRVAALIEKNPEQVASAVFVTSGGCPPIRFVKEPHHPNCAGLVESGMSYAQKPEINKVVIGAAWFSYFSGQSYYYERNDFSGIITPNSKAEELALAELSAMLAELKKAGKETYLILNIPVGSELAPQSMVERDILRGQYQINRSGISKDTFLEGHGEFIHKLSEMAASRGATVIDPVEYFCKEGRCPSITRSGEPIYKDSSHLRPSFVKVNAGFIDQTVIFDSKLTP